MNHIQYARIPFLVNDEQLSKCQDFIFFLYAANFILPIYVKNVRLIFMLVEIIVKIDIGFILSFYNYFDFYIHPFSILSSSNLSINTNTHIYDQFIANANQDLHRSDLNIPKRYFAWAVYNMIMSLLRSTSLWPNSKHFIVITFILSFLLIQTLRVLQESK